MTDEAIDRRDYGRLEAEVSQLRSDVHKLKETVEEMRDMMQQAKGGWRTALLIGGMSASVATAVTWIVAHVRLSP